VSLPPMSAVSEMVAPVALSRERLGILTATAP
jgi:hypothetical protein